jgi:hypothetical protein
MARRYRHKKGRPRRRKNPGPAIVLVPAAKAGIAWGWVALNTLIFGSAVFIPLVATSYVAARQERARPGSASFSGATLKEHAIEQLKKAGGTWEGESHEMEPLTQPVADTAYFSIIKPNSAVKSAPSLYGAYLQCAYYCFIAARLEAGAQGGNAGAYTVLGESYLETAEGADKAGSVSDHRANEINTIYEEAIAKMIEMSGNGRYHPAVNMLQQLSNKRDILYTQKDVDLYSAGNLLTQTLKGTIGDVIRLPVAAAQAGACLIGSKKNCMNVCKTLRLSPTFCKVFPYVVYGLIGLYVINTLKAVLPDLPDDKKEDDDE